MSLPSRQHRVLPGFGLTLGYTLFYLSVIVLVPLSVTFFKTAEMSWPDFLKAVASPEGSEEPA